MINKKNITIFIIIQATMQKIWQRRVCIQPAPNGYQKLER